MSDGILGKFQKEVIEDPRIVGRESSKVAKHIFDLLMQKAQWMDAIYMEDKNALDVLLQSTIQKHQKGLSDLVMNTKVFKYYSLMYLGSVYGYFGAENHRTKKIDKKVEALLKSQGYVAEEIAKIFSSKRYKGDLEGYLIYESKENLDSHLLSAITTVQEYAIGDHFTIDEDLTELVEERSRLNKTEKQRIPTKIKFLKEWLLS